MAIYHLNFRSHKVGSSAVAHSAYVSGQRLYSERTGETYDYGDKANIVHTGLLLPEGVEISREKLWNTIEANVKDEGRNYGKTGDFAIPIEWLDDMTDEKIIEIVSEFLTENFVKKGHAVDFAFHKKDGNPHIDYFVPQWKFDENGELVSPKIKSVFANVYDKETGKYSYDEEKPVYDKNDPETEKYRFPVIDKKTGKQKIRVRKGGNEKVWQRVNIENDSLNSKDFLLELRKNWEITANRYLDKEHQIDCRSLEAQGITDREPGIHISPAVIAMEKKYPGSTDKMKKFNEIKERNEMPKLLRALRSLQKEIKSITQKGIDFMNQAYRSHLDRLQASLRPQKEKEVKVWEPPKERNETVPDILKKFRKPIEPSEPTKRSKPIKPSGSGDGDPKF